MTPVQTIQLEACRLLLAEGRCPTGALRKHATTASSPAGQNESINRALRPLVAEGVLRVRRETVEMRGRYQGRVKGNVYRRGVSFDARAKLFAHLGEEGAEACSAD